MYKTIFTKIFIENIVFYQISIPNTDCEMETIGKPVYHNSLLDTYGSWMRDSFSEIGDFYYVTSEHNSTSLFQYNNKSAFINKSHSKVYKLNEPIVVSTVT